MDRRKAPMHSWRHFAKTYFKNDPRVKKEIHDAITGHGSDSEGRRYGTYELRAMAKAIATIAARASARHRVSPLGASFTS